MDNKRKIFFAVFNLLLVLIFCLPIVFIPTTLVEAVPDISTLLPLDGGGGTATLPPSTPAGGSGEKAGYQLLEPSVMLQTEETAPNLEKYLSNIYFVFLVIVVMSAVGMFVWGGLLYVVSDLPSAKGDGKDKIIHALLGLLN